MGSCSCSNTCGVTSFAADENCKVENFCYDADRLITKQVGNDVEIGIENLVEYDTFGNPIKYFGHAFKWTRQRLLSSVEPLHSHFMRSSDIWYKYNADGVRIVKNSGMQKTEFILDGTRILAERCREYGLLYEYGARGIVGFNVQIIAQCGILEQMNGRNFHYNKNIQG